MTINTCTRILAGLLASVPLLTTLSATSLPYREILNKNSRANGLGRAKLPLLERQPGRGAKVVGAELLARYRDSRAGITTAGAYTSDANGKRVRYTGADGWYLQVYGDGSAVRYRNYPYLDSASNFPLPRTERLPDNRLEALARSFIANDLARYVQLSRSDGLEAFSVVLEIDGFQQNIPGAPVREEVRASTVNFVRTVDGVPVVGRGSKVSVIFANNGMPVGFDLDWPTYAATGETQSVVGPSAVNQRALKILPVNPFAARSTIRRYECGYYDDGARRRDAKAPVQAACFIQYVATTVGDAARNKVDPNDGLFKAGYADAIPAGLVVMADQGWPQAMLLCTGEPGCGKAPPIPVPPGDPGPQ